MNYRCETDLAAIKDYLQNAPVVAFDFETAPLLQYRDDSRAALDAHRACIVGISLSVAEGSAIYIPLEHFDGGNDRAEGWERTDLQDGDRRPAPGLHGRLFALAYDRSRSAQIFRMLWPKRRIQIGGNPPHHLWSQRII